MSDLATFLKADRMVDYIADLKERQEEMEEIIADLTARVAALEEQLLALTGGPKESD